MLDCGRGHSGIKFDNRNPADWLAGESQKARGYLQEVGAERLDFPATMRRASGEARRGDRDVRGSHTSSGD